MDPNAEVWLSGSDQAFSDTDFYGSDFKVKIKPLTRSTKSAMQRKNMSIKRGTQVTDFDGLARDVFLNNVLDWEGVKGRDANGEVREIPCDPESKKQIANLNWPFADAIAAAIINRLESQDKANSQLKDVELGN